MRRKYEVYFKKEGSEREKNKKRKGNIRKEYISNNKKINEDLRSREIIPGLLKIKLRRIGNSMGIYIPKRILKENGYNLGEFIKLKIIKHEEVITENTGDKEFTENVITENTGEKKKILFPVNVITPETKIIASPTNVITEEKKADILLSKEPNAISKPIRPKFIFNLERGIYENA